jgi:rare lipoprotein A
MRSFFPLSLFLLSALITGCSLITLPYDITKGVISGTVCVVKGTYELTTGTAQVLYKIGEVTYEVVRAPADWALTHDEIDTIDGLPAKEAIRKGRVKDSPYTVDGKTYYPMSFKAAQKYTDEGIASWYGEETVRKNGYMTANGEVFNPNGLTAAHKYLPLPIHAKVTSIESGRSVIVRVNDRGPFPCEDNPASGDRIIDLSAGAARKLGFYEKGTARVTVEVVRLAKEDSIDPQ